MSWSSEVANHDTRLLAALKRIQEAGVTLNAQSCEFGKTTIKFLGHLINETGIRADPDKTRAIREMQAPTTVIELRRFLGMVNQLRKFTPHLTDLTQPLRRLLSKGNTWLWGPKQSNAFNRLKEELTKPCNDFGALRLAGPNQSIS